MDYGINFIMKFLGEEICHGGCFKRNYHFVVNELIILGS